MTDTIHALASGAGRAGVAVIRLSGPAAGDVLACLTRGTPLPAPRMASVRALYHPDDGALLDQALVLLFRGPASFTGEDVVELHAHGGRAVVSALTDAIGATGLARPAEPGEFTRRAFENGRMDLTAAEAIADLVDAETRAQAAQALRQLDGALGRLYGQWAEGLTRALALMEAEIDFPDEGDLPDGMISASLPVLDTIRTEIEAHLADGHRGERLREGIMVAVVGAPNAGKSSLVNALARRDVAIVSDIAGTTRDVIEVQLDLGGLPVTLADTAGLRAAAADGIEDEGIRRAIARAGQADIRLALFACDQPVDQATVDLVDASSLVVASKADKGPVPDALAQHFADGDGVHLSSETGAGLQALLDRLTARAADIVSGSGAPLTRARHRHALEEARDCLARAVTASLPELAAEDARLALRAIGRITGRVDVEDLLDRIFSEFCIGK